MQNNKSDKLSSKSDEDFDVFNKLREVLDYN